LINTDHALTILIHLKLTGQLIYQDAKTRVAGGHPIPPLNLSVPNKTTRVTFAFTNGGHLYFNDVRKFGWVKIVESEESKVKEAIGAELGPDPLKMSFEEFANRLKKRGQVRIKKLLMDQSFISGVGNIYSDEALWRAKIHPKRSAISLSPLEVRELYDGIRESLKLAIEKGGSSASAYVDSGGEKGLYLSFARAYHMTGKPCARCKIPIVREKIDGRSAHFCPACQKLD
jgi:formamidopyrimidine-DNA glycosylase